MNVPHGLYDGHGVLMGNAGILKHTHKRAAIFDGERARAYAWATLKKVRHLGTIAGIDQRPDLAL
jgi:hypothetical protein